MSMIKVDCPWQHEHTSAAEATFMGFKETTGKGVTVVFKCMHASCLARTIGDYLEATDKAQSFFTPQFDKAELPAPFCKDDVFNTLYLYETSPIDLGWEFLPRIDEAVQKGIVSTGFITRARQALMYHTDWEGDVQTHRDGELCEVIALIPCDVSFSPAYIVKQNNNGDTFIASTAKLTAETFGPYIKYRTTETRVL